MNQLTPVVKNLIILNAIVFVAVQMLHLVNPMSLALWFTPQYFKPYQLVTHMFMHADISHIFMNMLGLYFFGPYLEQLLGSKRFFILYFFAGAGAILLHYLVLNMQFESTGDPNLFLVPVMGASGCVFGVLAGFAMKFPNARVMLLIPPIPMKAWVLVVGYAVLELVLGMSRLNTGVAHFAHLGGGLFGALIILFWDRFASRYGR